MQRLSGWTGKVTMMAAALALIAMAGCADKTPNCGDPATVSLVQKIFREQLLPDKFKTVSAGTFDKGTRLELPTPDKFDKDVRKYTCEARFSVDASAGLDPETALAFVLLAGLGGDASALDKIVTKGDSGPRYDFTINYTSQDVDGQHIVRVGGVKEIQAALTGAFLANAEKSSSSEKTVALTEQPPPAATPTAPPPEPVATPAPMSSAVPQETAPSADKAPEEETPAPAQVAQIQRPGWCNKAGTDVERMICADDGLSDLDAKMYELYKSARDSTTDKGAFNSASRDWRVNRRDACTTVECIANAYRDRISELGG